MIFLRLFIVFSKIGIFNFGGGYAMLSLIQNEVVNKNHWMTVSEFTDIVAVSQSTPGPIGINAATYTGYTAVMNDPSLASLDPHMLQLLAILGAVLASLSIMWLPFILMISISRFLLTHKDSPVIKSIFSTLRPAIVGLLVAAALMLCTGDNFGSPTQSTFLFIVSITTFFFALIGTRLFKIHPIVMILLCGLAGLIIY